MIKGEPMVKNETYTKQVLIRLVEIPNRSPMAEHTPNKCHSINDLKRFIALN